MHRTGLPSALGLLVALALSGPPAEAQTSPSEPAPPPSIEEKTEGMTRLEGFFDLYWDERTGKLYWEIDRYEEEFLYQLSLASGLGSNPVGLDRGQLGGTYVLVAHRVGPRILLVEPNYRYRARSDNPDEVRAVREAFAPSVHWGFDVVAASGERALVDATDFFLRDAHGAAARMEEAGQGSYQLDKSRSAFHLPGTKAFPDNVEVETILTFTSPKPGRLVREVAASGEAVLLRQRHSLVRLPELGGYTPRSLDPRIGAFGPRFYDYAMPIDEDLEVRWVARHRLEKKDPAAARSEPVEPIVYYLDRGVPEPIRTALLEGARWWNEAFEAAGFIDAFRVEVLPEGADPMDVRYNMIHWTHRSTRGWSYGGSVVDPRTGEILKGNVNLGSLRLRQDYLIGQGLVPPFDASPSGCALAAAPGFEYLAQAAGADPVAMALARVRQLSAHEVGHTLGFPHNYIASTYGRASVMDYPAPLVRITDEGRLDLSAAYATGIGAYDKLAVRWLYGDFPPGTDEAQALEAIVREGLAQGLRFMAHTDNAFVGAGHALASVWDNGADLVAMLEHEIRVRRIALDGFGERAIRPGEPLSLLENVLVPLYLHHRFQLNAAVQSLGGADYTYALRGDGQTPIVPVAAAQQRRALAAVVETLGVDFLALPERLLDAIPPPAYRYPRRETFAGRTGLFFDPLAPVEASAQFSVEALLHPERMARLVRWNLLDPALPGLGEVVDALVEATWKTPAETEPYRAEVQRVVRRVALDELLRQASDPGNDATVRAILADRLDALAGWIEAKEAPTPHDALAAADIRRWQKRPWGSDEPGRRPEIPPGSPIGQGASR